MFICQVVCLAHYLYICLPLGLSICLSVSVHLHCRQMSEVISCNFVSMLCNRHSHVPLHCSDKSMMQCCCHQVGSCGSTITYRGHIRVTVQCSVTCIADIHTLTFALWPTCTPLIYKTQGRKTATNAKASGGASSCTKTRKVRLAYLFSL